MDQITIIEQTISLMPEFLNHDLEEVIIEHLKNRFIGTCTTNYGYIIDVTKLISYKSTIISPISGMPAIKVKFLIKNLKPTVGIRTDGIISTIKDNFILILSHDKIKTLISATKLKISGFVYNKVGVCYKREKDGNVESIRQGDIVSFEIFLIHEKDLVCLGHKLEIPIDITKKVKKPITKKVKKSITKKVKKV